MIPISRGSSYISRDAKMVKNKTKLTRSIFSFWWFCSWKVGLRMTFVQDYLTSSIRTGSDVIEPEVSQSEAPISETSSKVFEKKWLSGRFYYIYNWYRIEKNILASWTFTGSEPEVNEFSRYLIDISPNKSISV